MDVKAMRQCVDDVRKAEGYFLPEVVEDLLNALEAAQTRITELEAKLDSFAIRVIKQSDIHDRDNFDSHLNWLYRCVVDARDAQPPEQESAATWRADANDGMRFPEDSDLMGGETETKP